MKTPPFRYGDRKEYADLIAREFMRHVRDVAVRLGDEFKEGGITRFEVARQMGCSRQYVDMVLRGAQPVSAYKVACIAKLLGYRLRLVLEREEV